MASKRQIKVGNVPIGGGAPVVVQSMTLTYTHDGDATMEQIARLASAGCEVVRVAVPKTEDAEALSKIVYLSPIPVIADIHFNASLALKAIEAGVAAVRINPGNIGGADKVATVVKAAKAKGIPMRIGANSGSLPKHLIELAQKDTAEALVEEALEQVRLLESMDFYDFKISVKSSSVPTMIPAYRMLWERVPYPLPLGVTEAGPPATGSIKSAIGVGSLLMDGIGDTIRISLTADPVKEVEVAWEILKALGLRERGPVMIACPSCGRDNVGVEMNAIGGQEMFMPVVTPAELWQQTGRYSIPELWKIEDRMGRPFVLALTHEETVAFHAREIRSYRELPQILYHFQTKVRDEPRPRSGLLRVREFVMKDSYSFDRDEAGLERSFRLQEQAYHKIFERCGLEAVAVEAESGMMGGSESIDFLAPSGSGENTLVTCENGDYAADLEIARGVPRPPEFPERLDAPQEVETSGVTTIDGLAEFLGIDPAATSKAIRAQSAAASSGFRSPSKSATSSSSAPTTRSRSARASSTRTGRRSRLSWEATASGQAGSSPPPWSRTMTGTASQAGRPASRRTRSTSSFCRGSKTRGSGLPMR